MSSVTQSDAVASQRAPERALLVFSWLWVGLPLSWGVWETVRSSLALFR
jgi:hypothetical protein